MNSKQLENEELTQVEDEQEQKRRQNKHKTTNESEISRMNSVYRMLLHKHESSRKNLPEFAYENVKVLYSNGNVTKLNRPHLTKNILEILD